jgi:hypothetical protein
VVDDSDPAVESDLRRRAAWLLLMLVIVAVLLVVVISALVKTNGSSGDGGNGSGPLDGIATSDGSGTPSGQHPSTHHSHRPGTGGQSGSTTTAVPIGHISCPTSQRCILQGDVDGSAQAINTFRAQHGLPAVPTSVGPQAQSCAFHDGSGCSGSWALTYLSTPNAQEAVQKIDQYAHFEDPNIKSVQVGWAFDPGSNLYYFAIIRTG